MILSTAWLAAGSNSNLMFQNMTNSNTINPDESSINIGTSRSIDFPFWVLLEDGLHVPAFDKHSGGNKILQSLGMTQESWYEWLKLILISHDNRLCWHVRDINAQVQENVQSFKKMIGIVSEAHSIDYNAVYGQQLYDSQSQHYSKLLIDQERGYQEALTDYQGLDINLLRESDTPQLYQDNDKVRERLALLWYEYKSNKYSNEFLESAISTPIMWDVLENPPTNQHREIYLVDYPHEVEIFIPPIFAIVTVPNRPVERSDLDRRMFYIIQNS
ncbi:MAG: hypothetical protein RM338_03665 [Nostoc sp. DedQUE12a]|nr:hypothetical protein [Nostoc sp. DedQUE12a]